MFKRDLFEITDEEPAGFGDAREEPSPEPGGRPPTQAAADLREPEGARESAPRRLTSWHVTAALVSGLAGLLMSLVAIVARPAEPQAVVNAVQSPRAGASERDLDKRGRGVGAPVGRVLVQRPGPADVPVSGVRRRTRKPSHRSASRSAPVAPAAPPPEPAPQPAADSPMAPLPAEPPRAGEFDFEVGSR
jgi:hypothetical protein